MNPKEVECPACACQVLEIQEYQADIEFKGLDLNVSGLLRSLCTACGYEFSSHDQHDRNVAKIRETFLAQRAGLKKTQGLLSGVEIREIRKNLSLSQQEAAKLFGGGVNAFSKYENEEIVQSIAMDRLIRLVSGLGEYGVLQLTLAIEPKAEQRFVLGNFTTFAESHGVYVATISSIEPLALGGPPKIAQTGIGRETIGNRTFNVNPATNAMYEVPVSAEGLARRSRSAVRPRVARHG